MNIEDTFSNILRAIKREKCVLVLGDEFEIEEGKTLKNILFKELPYLQEDNFLHFGKLNDKTNACDIIEEELEEIKTPSIYKKLAQIPFHTIISLSFDSLIEKSFVEQKFDYVFDFYFKKQASSELDTPNKVKPLIYNLFGDIKKDESVIISKDDVFDFLFSILGSYKLPRAITEQLQKATNVIFLGCKYNTWQTELIMKLLDFKEGYALYKTESIAEAKRSFYIDTLHVEFMELSSQEFLEILYTEAKKQDLLRLEKDSINRLDKLSEQEIKVLQDHLEELIEKKEFYLSEKVITSDIEQKFTINKKIKQIEIDIKEARRKLEN